MRITCLTSNQPRHVALLETLAEVADEVFAIQECNTLFPGEVADFFNRSPVMQRYFRRVMDAERAEFGGPRLAPDGVRTLAMKMGDLNRLSLEDLGPALDADCFVIFGASYIRGPLCDALVARRAINIHMGVSPQYRGSSTNFWALYDRRPELVGATIHELTRGLDSGPILFHALPAMEAVDPFALGMRAVRAAHRAVADHIRSGALPKLEGVPQDRAHQLRYTRNADFTDAVAAEYLERLASPSEIRAALAERRESEFIRVCTPGAGRSTGPQEVTCAARS